jgi:hypothetical protein
MLSAVGGKRYAGICQSCIDIDNQIDRAMPPPSNFS